LSCAVDVRAADMAKARISAIRFIIFPFPSCMFQFEGLLNFASSISMLFLTSVDLITQEII